MDITQLYNEFQWFFSLGYVVIISTILTMVLVNIWKKTFLKKTLANSTATQKDSILSLAGTITSLAVFALVHFANEMIIQGKILIDFNATIQSITITSGAATTWVAAKGLYTVLHKFIGRIKDKKLTVGDIVETKKDLDKVKDKVIKSVGVEKVPTQELLGSLGTIAQTPGVPKVTLPKRESSKGTKKIL